MSQFFNEIVEEVRSPPLHLAKFAVLLAPKPKLLQAKRSFLQLICIN